MQRRKRTPRGDAAAPAAPIAPPSAEDRDQLWADLLARAVAEPGVVSKAYRAFHRYSLGNQIMALVECDERGIEPGPLATYNGWRDKQRQVRRGEKAIALWMPLTRKRTEAAPDEDGNHPVSVRFVITPKWFVASQTDPIDGAEVADDPPPDWCVDLALDRLGVERATYTMVDGNMQGYSNPKERTLALNPVAANPLKTTLHELGHILLHAELDAAAYHADRATRSQAELEAEAVVLLCLDALGLRGVDEARGYIQHWAGEDEEPPFDGATARRIMKAADQILSAGREGEDGS